MESLSVSADATLRGYAPDCIREPYLRATGARGYSERRVTAAIAFAEAVGRFFVALLAPEGQAVGELRALKAKLHHTSLGDWVATADALAREVVRDPQAVARPVALALRDASGRETPGCQALKALITARNQLLHGSDLGPDTARAQEIYQRDMAPALRQVFECLGFVRHLPIFALDRTHPSTGQPTRLVRFVGAESEAVAFSHRVAVRALEPLLIAPDGRAVELGPFMAVNLSPSMGLRPQLIESVRISSNQIQSVTFADPAGREALAAPPHWVGDWLESGHLKRPLLAEPHPHLAQAAHRPMAQLTGRTILGAEFGGFIARGANASVYRGRWNGLAVALKVLHSPLRSSESHRARMRRELDLLKRVRHPRVVRAHELYEDTEVGPILVMDLALGVDLERIFGTRQASVHEALRVAEQLLEAVEALHAQGVVHRDIKPANVLLDDQQVSLVDFGIARDHQSERLTGTLDRLGTRDFAAPEQSTGSEVGPAADLYAVGRLVAWLLLGSASELAGLPSGLAAWVRQATRLVPSERFPSARAMRQALHDLAVQGLDSSSPLTVGDWVHQHYRVVAPPTLHHDRLWSALAEETSNGRPVQIWFTPPTHATVLRAAVRRVENLCLVEREAEGLYFAVFQRGVDVLAGPPVPPVVGPARTPPAEPTRALGLPASLPTDPALATQRLIFADRVAEALVRVLVEGDSSAFTWFAAMLPGRRPTDHAGCLRHLEALMARGPSTGAGADRLRRAVLLPTAAVALRAAVIHAQDQAASYAEVLKLIALFEHEPLSSPVLVKAAEGYLLVVHARPADGARRLAAPETPAPLPESLQGDLGREWRRAMLLQHLGLVKVDQADRALSASNLTTGRYEVGYDAAGQPRVVVGYEPQLEGPPGRLALTTHALPWMQHHRVRLLGFTDGMAWRWVRREGVRDLLGVQDPRAWLAQNPR